ncbi:unnamed protein product, partial [Sphacelaria rigidula]
TPTREKRTSFARPRGCLAHHTTQYRRDHCPITTYTPLLWVPFMRIQCVFWFYLEPARPTGRVRSKYLPSRKVPRVSAGSLSEISRTVNNPSEKRSNVYAPSPEPTHTAPSSTFCELDCTPHLNLVLCA